MTTPDHHEIIKQICDYMGEDLDGEACKEVQEHLALCPACRVYFDEVKKTVTLVRRVEQPGEKMPDDVKERLFKVLDLDELMNR